MSTIKKQHLFTLPAVNSKAIAVGIVILIVLFAGIMYLSSDNTGKGNSTPGIVPLLELENNIPITGDNSEPTEVPDEVVPIAEITGYEDVGVEEYMKTNHECYLEGANPTAYSAIGNISEQDTIYGKKFYLNKISIKKGEEGHLNFSILYKDDNGTEQVWLNFKSTEVKDTSIILRDGKGMRQFTYSSYSGCLTNPKETEYKRCTGKNVGITAIERSPETGGFTLEGAFFSGDKKEIGGSEISSRSSYRLVIKHD